MRKDINQRIHDLCAVHSNFKQLKELFLSREELSNNDLSEVFQELEESLQTLKEEINRLQNSQSSLTPLQSVAQ